MLSLGVYYNHIIVFIYDSNVIFIGAINYVSCLKSLFDLLAW